MEQSSGLLYVYDFRTKKYGKRSPIVTCAINNYYKQAWAEAGVDPYALEDFFAKVVEPHGKAGLERLNSMATDMRPEETVAVLSLIESQRLRVPRQARLMKELHDCQVASLYGEEFAAAYHRGEIKLTEVYRFDAMRACLGEMMMWCGRMEWLVIKAPQNVSFITTDNPVIFFNPRIIPPLEAGIAFAGTKVLYPMSPSRMLMMYHPECRRSGPLDTVPRPPKEDRGIKVHFWPEPADEGTAQIWNGMLVQMCDHTVVGTNENDIRDAVGRRYGK